MTHDKKDTLSPVLFLTFNRPVHTAQVFAQIKKVRPPKLFLSSDGPRNSEDEVKVKQVRKILGDITWDCEVKTLYQDKNLGGPLNSKNALSWFFSNVEQGIILEDDTYPHLSFFSFCDQLLEHYKSEERIWCVSGLNYSGIKINNSNYFFSRLLSSWGWASWRRAWEKGENDLTANHDLEFIKNMFDKKIISDYWYNFFKNYTLKNKNNWDARWLYSMWKNNGLCCYPKKNLIKNIGFGPEGQSTEYGDGRMNNLELECFDDTLVHPGGIKVNYEHENFVCKNQFYIRWYVLLMKKIFKTIGLYQQFVMFASFVLTRYNRVKKLFTLGSKNH